MRWPALLAAVVLAGCAAPPSTVTPGRTARLSAPTHASADASATASPSAINSPSATPQLTTTELRAAVQASDIRAHLQELQQIADANGGNRATGTTGFDASVEYLAGRLAAAGYEVARQTVTVSNVSSVNLVVERAGANDEVIMMGAHLDSVVAGPGINDNGSGVATLLVVAERLADLPAPSRTIRLAFWGAEEGGPHGSRAYVDALSPNEIARIGAYLNFDMLGSPNPIRFVYAEAMAAKGSEELTSLFTAYFDDEGLPWAPIDLEGDSDHGPFIGAGIPTGGLFSGGIEPKSDAQAAVFGGTPGEPADACSHRVCDTIDNISDAILGEMADAVAHAAAALAAGG